MISIFTWISIVTGGILILFMLLSLLGGLDLDFDLSDTEADAGDFGVVKGTLTFISVTSWVIKILLATQKHPALAITVGIIAGAMALFVLSYFFKLLLKNEENVNWKMTDAQFKEGKVYLRIPAEIGSGIVQVNINGATRELKAKTNSLNEIPTGESIIVTDIENEFVIVEPVRRNEF